MPRKIAKELRVIAKNAQIAERERIRLEVARSRQAKATAAKDKKRRALIWSDMYYVAINGGDSLEIKNLDKRDAAILSRAGLSMTLLYRRNKERGLIEEEIRSKLNQLEELRASLELLQGGDEWRKIIQPLCFWIKQNKDFAREWGLEPWFGQGLDRVSINNAEEFESFRSLVERRRRSGLFRKRSSAKGALWKAILSTGGQLTVCIKAKERLGVRIDWLENAIRKLRTQGDYKYAGNIRTIHQASWQSCPLHAASCKHAKHHTVSALQWLCSHEAQSALERFDADASALAGRGAIQMPLSSSLTVHGLYLEHKGAMFSTTFPSEFDFLETMRILGYEISREEVGAQGAVFIVRW